MPWLIRDIKNGDRHSCPLPDPGNVDDDPEGLWVCPDPECRIVWRNCFNTLGDWSDRSRSWYQDEVLPKRRHRRLMAAMGVRAT